jgi:UDP-N-acetylglucosamine:LPS N-acetylglucosamine transferase
MASLAFPEFDPDKRRILWFCRGRGRGHAVPDLEIARALEQLTPDAQVHFVSYGTGARTLEEFGRSVVDLELPDLGSITDATVLSGKLIGWLEPDLVVSHEEFPALPAAKIFGRRTVAILDFFSGPESLAMQSLRCADRILFTDRRGCYPEPPFLKGRVRYTGPVLRRFTYTRKDRGRARRELGIAADALVVAVFPGSWTEAMAPIARPVWRAFASLPKPKHLIWLAGSDAASLPPRPDVTVIEREWQIERLMVAADVAITKSSRKTMLELETLGIPAIHLSSGRNPVDDARSAEIAGHRTAAAREVSGKCLAGLIRELAATRPRPVPRGPAVATAAHEILRLISCSSTSPAKAGRL